MSLSPSSIESAIKQACEYSYHVFLVQAFKEVLKPEEPYISNWHIGYLCDVLQNEVERIDRNEAKTQDIVINIPPRSMKSIITTVCLNAWAWIDRPYMKFITASYSGDLAIEHAVETRRLIQSEWYQSKWGDRFQLSSDQNVKSRFTNDKGGSRKSTSVGGTLTGSGGDIIIVDDAHKPQEVDSDVTRKSVIDWYKKTAYSRLNNQSTGIRIVVMQRLHEDDLTGVLTAEPGYNHICLPAENKTPILPKELEAKYVDGLLSPTRFSRQVLKETEKTIGSLEYATQYLQSPAPLEGNVIKKHWFKTFKMNELPANTVWDFFSDTAYGKEGSDNSATVCYAMHGNNIYIKDMWVVNLAFPDFIRDYLSRLDYNGYTEDCRCYFEPKASGISIVQQLREKTTPKGLVVNAMQDAPPTESKLSRLKAVSPMVESGRVHLLDGAHWIESFMQEIMTFPNAKHDDQVDAFVSALKLCQNQTNITII